MVRPNIQIDDVVREMTEEEYAELLASGWTEEAPVDEGTTTDDDFVVEETPVVDEPLEGDLP